MAGLFIELRRDTLRIGCPNTACVHRPTHGFIKNERTFGTYTSVKLYYIPIMSKSAPRATARGRRLVSLTRRRASSTRCRRRDRSRARPRSPLIPRLVHVTRARARESHARAPAATNRRDPRATTTTPRAVARRHDRGPRRMIRDTPVSPVLDSRARRERRRRARWTRVRFGGRRRGTRVDANASTDAHEREIRTSIGAKTMI